MTDDRGLVVSCPIHISGNTLFLKSSSLDPQELRFALLFWDKLDFPTNNFMRIGLDPNAEFLVDAGILQRTDVKISGIGGVAESFVAAHVHAYRSLDHREPGVWSLSKGENSIAFPQADTEQGRGILIRLYQAIPVPDKDVPLQDILEFRDKHRSELLALRYHLEAIYERVVSAGDGELALNTNIGALEQAIASHIKVSKESKMPFGNMSFDVSLNVPAGVAAGLAANSVSFDIIQSLLVGFGAAFRFGPGISLKGRQAGQTPFQYISSFHDKVF